MRPWVSMSFALGFALLGGACSKPSSQRKDVVVEPHDATVALASSDAPGGASTDAGAGADATARVVPVAAPQTFATHAGDDAWVMKLPRASTFTRVDLGADASAILEIAWRAYPSRTLKNLPADDDYGGNHPRKLELVVTRGAVTRTIALGEHGGGPARTSLTACFRQEKNPDPSTWMMIPPLPNLVSSFAMQTIQSGSDFLLVLGKDVLHLLHRTSQDGACGDLIKQGPLEACPDARWSLFADIKVRGEPPAKETVSDVDDSAHATPFDCRPTSP